MKLTFQRKPPAQNHKEQPSPGTSWNAYLLTDDLVHTGVAKIAEKIEGKTGLSREKQAYGVIATGTVTASIGDLSGAPFLALCAAGACLAVHELNKIFSKSLDRTAVLPHNPFLRFMTGEGRLMYLLSGLLTFPLSRVLPELNNFKFFGVAMENYGIFSIAAAIGFYMVSHSNGMLERAKNWLKNMKEKLVSVLSPKPVQDPVPVLGPDGVRQ